MKYLAGPAYEFSLQRIQIVLPDPHTNYFKNRGVCTRTRAYRNQTQLKALLCAPGALKSYNLLDITCCKDIYLVPEIYIYYNYYY